MVKISNQHKQFDFKIINTFIELYQLNFRHNSKFEIN